MSRFGRQKRTQADKRAAALAFVVMSEKPADEKAETLARSYGFTDREATEFVARHGRAA